MIITGKTAKREVESVKLSRYACYIIVQNADPNKQIVALGLTYFAIQTRLQEIRQMDHLITVSAIYPTNVRTSFFFVRQI